MAQNKQTTSGTGEIVGIRSDVYERHWELIWMTKDDVETFESRIGDRTMFQNIATLLLGASIPLGVEKIFDYMASKSDSDLGILIVCMGALVIGCVFQSLALNRRRKITSFKEKLFQNEKLVDRQFTMIDSSGSTIKYAAKG